MQPALTPAMQASTRITYPGGMEGWVDVVVGYITRLFACPQTITHPGTRNLLIVSPTSHPDHYATSQEKCKHTVSSGQMHDSVITHSPLSLYINSTPLNLSPPRHSASTQTAQHWTYHHHVTQPLHKQHNTEPITKCCKIYTHTHTEVSYYIL